MDSRIIWIAAVALVVLAIVTLFASQEPGHIDPDNPPPAKTTF